MMKKSGAKLQSAAILLAFGMALSVGANSLAATQGGHDHQESGVPTLRLNAGKKWQTDAPLREGMGKIRDVIDGNLAPVHGGKVTAAQYKAIAGDINGQIAYIVKNCKLDKEADEVLHGIIGQMAAGADAMEGNDRKTSRSAGFVKVAQSLDNYARYFDHAGWKAPKAGH